MIINLVFIKCKILHKLILKGINTIDSLNFVNQVTYDTLGNNINIYFNPSCVLTCNIDRFRDIYNQRLEWLVSEKYKLGWAPFYLKPVDFGGD